MTCTETGDPLHGFITSFFKNDDKFPADDLRTSADLFTNSKSVIFLSNFVTV